MSNRISHLWFPYIRHIGSPVGRYIRYTRMRTKDKDKILLCKIHITLRVVVFIMNIRTVHITPQYHVVFDDIFSTAYHMKKGTVQGNCKKLV